jgi:hypothetical protein
MIFELDNQSKAFLKGFAQNTHYLVGNSYPNLQNKVLKFIQSSIFVIFIFTTLLYHVRLSSLLLEAKIVSAKPPLCSILR